MKTVSAIILTTALLWGKLNAQVVLSDATGWHKIGETTVDFKTEKDEIKVVGANRFASIKFKVKDAPINLIDMELYYDSATVHKITVNSPIPAGAESKVIDLKGTEPNIRKIVFVYRTVNNRKDEKAHVEVWGYKTNEDKNKK
jgi:hypothetical protein